MFKFGERLKELRIERKISARLLGKEINVSDSTILRWENNQMKPSVEYLYALCTYFGVSADYLIGLED